MGGAHRLLRSLSLLLSQVGGTGPLQAQQGSSREQIRSGGTDPRLHTHVFEIMCHLDKFSG